MADESKFFNSARLTYKAIESPDHDNLFRALDLDVNAQANAVGGLPKPPSKSDTLRKQAYIGTEMLIGVVICIKAEDGIEDIPIGEIHMIMPQQGQEYHRNATIGVGLLKEYRGKGYGSEAIKWITGWGFMFAGLHRVTIGCFAWNQGAKRLYERLGFVLEGTKRESLWFDGRFWDQYEMGLLEQEYKELITTSWK